MTILIICSFLLQGILYLESIGLLRFRRIIDSALQGLHIGTFVAEIISLGQCIHLATDLQHYATEIFLELQVHIYIQRGPR